MRRFTEMYNIGRPSYLDFPTEDAPTYLKRMLDSYRTGVWVSDLDSEITQTNQWAIVYPPKRLDSHSLLMVDSLMAQSCDVRCLTTITDRGENSRRDSWGREGRAVIEGLMME